MILIRIAYFFFDMMRSMFRTLYASLRGPDKYTMGWASLYVGGLSAQKIWLYGHIATINPATIVIVRSFDDHWIYVHCLFGSEKDLKAYEKDMTFILGLPRPPASELAASDLPVLEQAAPAEIPPAGKNASPPAQASTSSSDDLLTTVQDGASQ